MYRQTFTMLLLLLSVNALGNPSVASVTLDDQGLEILGSNFGSENPMLFWDDAQTHFESLGAQSGSSVVTSGSTPWRANTNSYGEPFTYLKSTLSKSQREEVFYYGTGHKNFLGEPNHPKVESLKNTLYASWWYKPGSSPSAEGGSNKFIRIWDETNGNGTRISWTQMHLTCADSVIWGNWNGAVNQWNHHAILVDLVQQNIKTWVNGVKVHDGACTKNQTYRDNHLYVGLIGFDHGSENYRTMTTAIDDIYIAKSQARVELSSNAYWSATMPKEVLPIQSWSNTRILASSLTGVLRLSSESYIYVIDDQGRVNSQGIKVNCLICPKW